MGFAAACNLGVSLTNASYVAIVNNDTAMWRPGSKYPYDGWTLMDLCHGNKVMFPQVNGVVQEFTGAFLVIPRDVIKRDLGGKVFDERFEVGFWEDVDLWTRLKAANVEIEQAPYYVDHPMPGSTMRYMPDDTDSKNRSLYIEKHGKLPIKNWS